MAYYFNLPLITELTPGQQRAVNETNPLALSGGPGTGKSVVSLWRHIRNHSTGLRNSLLLTYTRTLEHYLKASANTQSILAGENINRIFWWLNHVAITYEEIIIDEGQDIAKPIFNSYFNYTNRISYGADERQILYLTPTEWIELKNWFDTDEKFENNRQFGTITLQRNFRNSKEILLFTRSVFPNFHIPQITVDSAIGTDLKPIMKLELGWNINAHADAIIDIINDFQSDTHNIAILVPFQRMADNYYDAIRSRLENSIALTKFSADDEIFNGLSGVHITPFKSSKGTEFDTVIIPEFDRYDWILAHMDKITENDYYVAFTRTKTNLFLLCRDGFPNIGDNNTITIE